MVVVNLLISLFLKWPYTFISIAFFIQLEQTALFCFWIINHGGSQLYFSFSQTMRLTRISMQVYRIKAKLILYMYLNAYNDTVLPLPSQGPNAKFGLEGIIVSFSDHPPVLFKLRALKPDQGLSRQTRGFQARYGWSLWTLSDFRFQILDVRFQF